MPMSRSYHAMNGELIAETSGGQRRDYLTDALQSITAEVDSAGSILGTRRYKPYGGILASAGSMSTSLHYRSYRNGAASSLLFAPGFTYRFSDAFTTAQLYPNAIGIGTFYGGAVNLKVPVCGGIGAPWHKLKGQPVRVETATIVTETSGCTQSRFKTNWSISHLKVTTGSVIQRMTISVWFPKCTRPTDPCGCTSTLKYLEGWPALGGKLLYKDDEFGWSCAEERCRSGTATWLGEVGYFDGCTVEPGWQRGDRINPCRTPWGTLPHIDGHPPGFAAGPGRKKSFFQGNCCKLPIGNRATMSFRSGDGRQDFSRSVGSGWGAEDNPDCKSEC
jgi:hypothetical protein